jgi:hypothetical protein
MASTPYRKTEIIKETPSISQSCVALGSKRMLLTHNGIKSKVHKGKRKISSFAINLPT